MTPVSSQCQASTISRRATFNQATQQNTSEALLYVGYQFLVVNLGRRWPHVCYCVAAPASDLGLGGTGQSSRPCLDIFRPPWNNRPGEKTCKATRCLHAHVEISCFRGRVLSSSRRANVSWMELPSSQALGSESNESRPSEARRGIMSPRPRVKYASSHQTALQGAARPSPGPCRRLSSISIAIMRRKPNQTPPWQSKSSKL